MKSALDIVAGKHSHLRKPVVYQSTVDDVARAVRDLRALKAHEKMRLTQEQRKQLKRARRRLSTMMDLP